MKNLEKIPNSYHLGKSFFEDDSYIDVKIVFIFSSNAYLDDFKFEYKNFHGLSHQAGNDLTIIYERKLSQKLFNSLTQNRLSTLFIIGYIDDILPEINRKILEQKYFFGHLLNKTFSPMEIRKLYVENVSNDETIELDWPIAILPFPHSAQLAKEADQIFIRDYIDAMTCYFSNNLDECIRKMITSLENFFIFKKITGDKEDDPNPILNFIEKIIFWMHFKCGFKNIQFKSGTFKSKLLESSNEQNYGTNWREYITIWVSNVLFIYKIRNGIVHKQWRMDQSDHWICEKGLITLSYIFQTALIDTKTRKYLFSLRMQFLAIQSRYHGFNLDRLADGYKKKDDGFIIDNPKDTAKLDKMIFSSLEFSENEKREFISRFN